MTSVGHPKLPSQRGRGSFDLTTFDNVSGSPSKLKYSFGKGTRFPSVNRRTHDLVGYTLPSTRKPRAAGFGIGERFGSNKKGNRKCFLALKFWFVLTYIAKLSPPPDAYTIPTVFSPNNTTSTFAVHCRGPKTFAFGTGRESYGKVVLNRENL